MIEKEVVLEVKNLKKYFPASHKRVLKAVDDVSFTIHKGETFGIVGESGFPYEDRRTGVVSGKRCASDE